MTAAALAIGVGVSEHVKVLVVEALQGSSFVFLFAFRYSRNVKKITHKSSGRQDKDIANQKKFIKDILTA